MNNLKTNSNNNTKGECNIDKVSLFINLVRKYCKKLFALVNLDNQTNTETSQASNELIMTIEQFSKMVFNKKVDKLMMLPSSVIKSPINDTNENDNSIGNSNSNSNTNGDNYRENLVMKYNTASRDKAVELFISKYEENLAKMKKENEELINLLQQKEEELIQAKNANSEEIVTLRRKLYDQMKRNDDIEKHLICLKTVNRDIESKCMLLEEENNLYKRKMNKSAKKTYRCDNVPTNKYATDKNTIDNRNEYIVYLESLLNKENVKHNNSANEKYDYSNVDKHKDKFDELINQPYNKKECGRENEGIKCLLEKDDKEKESDSNDNLKKNKSQKEEDNDYKSLLTSERPLKIKKEIEEIDKEIFELQSKLRLMLDKK